MEQGGKAQERAAALIHTNKKKQSTAIKTHAQFFLFFYGTQPKNQAANKQSQAMRLNENVRRYFTLLHSRERECGESFLGLPRPRRLDVLTNYKRKRKWCPIGLGIEA